MKKLGKGGQWLVLAVIVLMMAACKKNSGTAGERAMLPITMAASDYITTGVVTSSANGNEKALTDKDAASSWRSDQTNLAGTTQWVEWTIAADSVNYIKLYPAYSSGEAKGFPVSFSVYYKQGDSWVKTQQYTDFAKPLLGPVILPLKEKVFTNAVRLVAERLSRDGDNMFSLQLAEVISGYDGGFEQWHFVENNKAAGQFQVWNVGSDSFNPTQLENWNYDYRNPILVAKPGGNSNIYAPYVVPSGNKWHLYFGGWDGSTDGFDRVSLTVSSDDFITLGEHQPMISNGVMIHLNNETVLRQSDNEWLMYYTTYGGNPAYNKPGYASSTDGIHWTPAAGNFDYLLKMTGYPDWPQADVNGSNVVLYQNGIYYLYFNDFNHLVTQNQPLQVYYATSTDGIQYEYQGAVLSETKVAQDVKRFVYNNQDYYLMVMHLNGDFLNYSMGANPASFNSSKTLLKNENEKDRYITSAGWVNKDNRLYGVIYGAGAVPSLDRNAIFAKWLQKKLVFKLDASNETLSQAKAFGPDRQVISASKAVMTGKFFVYASDGQTLLFTSPSVTVTAGDIWQFGK